MSTINLIKSTFPFIQTTPQAFDSLIRLTHCVPCYLFNC